MGNGFEDGRRFQPGEEVTYIIDPHRPYTSYRLKAVVLSSAHNKVQIEFVGGDETFASNSGWDTVIWVAPNRLVPKYDPRPVGTRTRDYVAWAIVILAVLYTLAFIMSEIS